MLNKYISAKINNCIRIFSLRAITQAVKGVLIYVGLAINFKATQLVAHTMNVDCQLRSLEIQSN